MSSSLLSEPSTVKLLPRERSPLTANCPAEPTPGPTPGPATLPSVCGGGATPGSNKANSSKLRAMALAPKGKVETSSSVNEPLRRASVVATLAQAWAKRPAAGRHLPDRASPEQAQLLRYR